MDNQTVYKWYCLLTDHTLDYVIESFTQKFSPGEVQCSKLSIFTKLKRLHEKIT